MGRWDDNRTSMNDILINGAAARPAVAWRSNIALLYAARGLRGFGDGFAIIILPARSGDLVLSP